MQKKDPEGSPVFENLYFLKNKGENRNVSKGLKATLLWHLLSRVKFLLSTLVKMLIIKTVLNRKDDDRGKEEFLLFATLYPLILKDVDGKLRDRNFLKVPDEIEKTSKFKTRYISFFHGSIFQLLKDIRRLRREKIIFYERYLKFSDLLRALGLATIAKYIFIERKKGFRDSFYFEGLGTFKIFRDELRTSFVGKGICECVLLSGSMERILKEYNVSGVVTFLEMYPYSRALYYAAKKCARKVKTVAYQHASITPMKLWYSYTPDEISFRGDYINKMPVPDYFLFNGKMGKDILIKSGYPENRCFSVGSLRLDESFKLGKGSINTQFPSGKKIVLVTTTYTEKDSRNIISMVSDVSKRRSDCFLVFKAHSNYPIGPILKDYDLQNYTVSQDSVYQLIQISDCLVTSYSTTAEEAIALGCPAITIDTGALINMSVIFEIEAAPAVRTADELNAAIDLVLYEREGFGRLKNKWPELIEASFYKLDGKAEERFLSSIRTIFSKELSASPASNQI